MFLDVGVEPHDVTEEMPDIMEIRKKESPGENSFYNDPDINQMSIQVRRMARAGKKRIQSRSSF